MVYNCIQPKRYTTLVLCFPRLIESHLKLENQTNKQKQIARKFKTGLMVRFKKIIINNYTFIKCLYF